MVSLRCALGVALAFVPLVTSQFSTYVYPQVLDACPGYNASNVWSTASSLKADLTLAGSPCDVFGNDIKQLSLEVTYETVAPFFFDRQGLASLTSWLDTRIRLKLRSLNISL